MAANSNKYPMGTAVLVDLVVIVIITLLAFYFTLSVVSAGIAFVISALIVFALSIRVIKEWNRMPVLRLGQYKGIIGPGFYLIIPIIESTPVSLDLRVISTTFRAEKTLTMDNVPVDVDAILFWHVLEPEKSVLNVQSYIDSVQLASQTAMRDIIGKNELSKMLAGRDVIGEAIQSLIEDRIKIWGLEAISVEIRDVSIPQELQNAMARVATSDREKQARVILAESESLAADKMLEAAGKYEKNMYALQLRALNMMYEISVNGKNLMVFIPTESKGFSIPTPLGVAGLQDINNMMKKQQKKGGASSSQ